LAGGGLVGLGMDGGGCGCLSRAGAAKRCYVSRRAAKASISARGAKALEPYACPVSEVWHLASTASKRAAKRRRRAALTAGCAA